MVSPQNSYVKFLTSSTSNVTLFENRVSVDVISWGHRGGGWTPPPSSTTRAITKDVHAGRSHMKIEVMLPQAKKLSEVRREAWRQTLPSSLQKKHVVLRPGKLIQGPCKCPHSTQPSSWTAIFIKRSLSFKNYTFFLPNSEEPFCLTQGFSILDAC